MQPERLCAHAGCDSTEHLTLELIGPGPGPAGIAARIPGPMEGFVMPCERFGGAIVCSPSGPYFYKGIYWEWHPYFGPHPIYKKTLQPWAKVPDHVWTKAASFAREANREQFLVEA